MTSNAVETRMGGVRLPATLLGQPWEYTQPRRRRSVALWLRGQYTPGFWEVDEEAVNILCYKSFVRISKLQTSWAPRRRSERHFPAPSRNDLL
jgi:hypothetical protein